ncbi:hydrogenase maturation nickel metallochaperone HypA [Desulforudis sp. 1088]|uniref:hydrogenase maturation nickel metallochaperone HypA/HybF n=1 Tax=unclassified Candidatus Desulforudis TaxID=2635950 RepID=UPI003487120A
MHEIGLIAAVMDEITKAAAENDINHVNKVKLVVGKANGALPEVLEFAWQILKPDTIFAQASLEIEQVDITLECLKCGRTAVVDGVEYFCPACGSRARIVKGDELYIDYFEGEKEDQAEVEET